MTLDGSPANQLRVALSLMRMALPLLDRAGNSWAACHLQQAIDAAEGNPPIQPGDELAPELIDRLAGQLPEAG